MTRLIVTLLAVSLSVTSLAQLPNKDSLTDLRSKWLAARKRAMTPVDEAYLKQLTAMKVTETKKGNLEAANRIAEEITRVTEEIALDETSTMSSDAIRTALNNSMWTGVAGLLGGWTIQLKENGGVSLTRPDNTPGWGGWSWSVDNDGKVTFKIPETAGPTEVKLSKRLDRMTLGWGESSLKRAQVK